MADGSYLTNLGNRPAGRAGGPPSTWWWFLVPLVTLGFGTFPMVFYGGLRLRSTAHRLAAFGYLAATVAFCVGTQFADEEQAGPLDGVLLVLLLVTWLGGVAHVVVLQTRVRAAAGPAGPPADPALAAAQRRSERRSEARRLVSERPDLAAELHIGRPDLPRQYDDGGLVDVNHVPAGALVRELDLTPGQAAEIVEGRARCGGFTVPDELIVYCDSITPQQVAAIGGRLLFRPL